MSMSRFNCPSHWSLKERLDHRSLHDPTTGCILWTGCCNSDGYGYLGVNRRTMYAHRAAWTAVYGPIPTGLSVCHRCDVPACINPEHLFLGTQKENMADRSAKFRKDIANGVTRPRSERKRPPPPEFIQLIFQGREIVGRIMSVRPVKASSSESDVRPAPIEAVSTRTPRPAGRASRATSARRQLRRSRGPRAPQRQARGW